MTKQPPLERYVLILEEVASANTSGRALSDLARRCQLPLPTVYRIVQGLIKAGLLVPREGTKHYVLGSRLFRLLHAGTDDGWLKIASQPTLNRLADVLNETAYLAQLVGKKIVSISWAVPESGLRSKVYPGDVMPPHAAASAKAILAHQPDSVVLRALSGVRDSYTAHTRTDLAQLRKEHVRIRKEGFATCWNEMELGLGGIACPIEVEGIGVQYAVAATGLTARLKARPVAETVAILEKSARDLKQVIESSVRDAGTGEPARSVSRASTTTRSSSDGQLRPRNARTKVA